MAANSLDFEGRTDNKWMEIVAGVDGSAVGVAEIVEVANEAAKNVVGAEFVVETIVKIAIVAGEVAVVVELIQEMAIDQILRQNQHQLYPNQLSKCC